MSKKSLITILSIIGLLWVYGIMFVINQLP